MSMPNARKDPVPPPLPPPQQLVDILEHGDNEPGVWKWGNSDQDSCDWGRSVLSGFVESPMNRWEEFKETDLRRLHINDFSIRIPDASVGQKRRASSPPGDSYILDSPHATSLLDSNPRGSISTRNYYGASLLESWPFEGSQRPTNSRSRSTLTNIAKISGVYMCECCPKKPKKFESQEELEYRPPIKVT